MCTQFVWYTGKCRSSFFNLFEAKYNMLAKCYAMTNVSRHQRCPNQTAKDTQDTF